MARATETTVYHFDHRDRQLGVLRRVSDCYREFDVNKATDTLTVQTETFVDKHDRLVVRGRNGRWLEYVVEGPSDDDGGEGGTYVGELSLNELAGHYIDERRPTGDCAGLLDVALEGTRWESLGSDIEAEPVTQVWYHTNSQAALVRIASTFGGEIEYRYEVEGGRVTRRMVGIFKRVGADRGRTFEYGRDLLGVARECEPQPVYTRVYGYGSGVETFDESGEATGGYTRKINFADVNGGKPYVESEEARLRYGVPNAAGEMEHFAGKVEFDDCKDPSELLRLTTEWAEAQWEPQWSYTVDVLALDGVPLDRGDDATIYDRMYDPTLVIRKRVVQGHEDYLRAERDAYTLGTVNPMVSDMLVDQEQARRDLTDRADNLDTRAGDVEERSKDWDDASDVVENIPGEWLRKQMDRLNQEFDRAGECYKFTSLEKGDIWANGPVTEDGRPEGDTDHAVNICSLGLRVAKDVRDGDFDYTTFITGDGATASLINVGRLVCGDNFLDLDTGEMRIALTAKVGEGGADLSGYVQNVSNTAAGNAAAGVRGELSKYVPITNFDTYLNLRNVFNALTHDGVDKGFFTQDGQVFVNADYVRTGVIESTDGLSRWDLNTGFFETTSTVFHNMHSRIDNGMFAVKMDETDLITMGAYTRESDPDYHPSAIKGFTDLVLSCAGHLGVGMSSTLDNSLTYTQVVREGNVPYVESVSGGTDSVSVTRRYLHVIHGMVVGWNSTPVTTYSTASVEHMELAASEDPAAELGSGDAIAVSRIESEDQLMEAAEGGRMVWQVGDGMSLGMPVYTGEEWTMGVPAQDPADGADELTMPTTAYVDAQAEALQAEIEAIAGALDGAVGTSRAKALRANLANVGTALTSGGAKGMRTAAASVAGRGTA